MLKLFFWKYQKKYIAFYMCLYTMLVDYFLLNCIKMNKKTPDLSETTLFEQESINTIEDILGLDIIQETIITYKDTTIREFPEADYNGYSYADVLREILSPDWYADFQIFLKTLKQKLSSKEYEHSFTEDTRFIVSIILGLESLRDMIAKTPSSIGSLAKRDILSVIEEAEKTSIDHYDEYEDITRYDGINNLLEMGFPCITTEGDIVYYIHGWESEIAYVWSDKMWSEVCINRNGKILDNQEIEEIYAWQEYEKLKAHGIRSVIEGWSAGNKQKSVDSPKSSFHIVKN